MKKEEVDTNVIFMKKEEVDTNVISMNKRIPIRIYSNGDSLFDDRPFESPLTA